jgi:hypothetical protein
VVSAAKKREDAEYVNLLKSIFGFLLATGAEPEGIRAIVDRALSDVGKQKKRMPRRSEIGLATAGRILDAWHRSRRYTDADAEPLAIPLLGRSPSVEALVRSESPRADAVAFARHLKSLGLLTRTKQNRFKPATRVAVIAGLNPLIPQYIARSSATLLDTIRQNVTKPARSTRLIERFAEVPDLPVRWASEFRKFSHEQGWAMLKTLNDWLESRRLRRTGGADRRTVRAGMHLYAYVDKRRVKRRAATPLAG